MTDLRVKEKKPLKAWRHYKTITAHRHLVMKYCFKVGLYRQGLMHDLSKYLPVEFSTGVRFYQGDRSPNSAEKEQNGYSAAWLHHKGRNKHHFEYWIDYGPGPVFPLAGMKMPVRYVAEMFIDRVAACKIYQKDAYTDGSALTYFIRGRHYCIMHEQTEALLEQLLTMLKDEGEDKTLKYVKQLVKSNQY